MVEKKFQDSVYRFTEPVRYFKANDPYYFEVDNIPIKQLEENCLWLKDQLTQTAALAEDAIDSNVKRSDIDELLPYATGTDRVIRVKPGRFSARVNDLSSKDKLQYLIKALGEEIGDIDQLQFLTDSEGTVGGTNTTDSFNAKLQAALDKFKSIVANDALGMTGLAERAFTWPVFDNDTPINDGSGVNSTSDNVLNYGGTNSPEWVKYVPSVVTQALLWFTSPTNSPLTDNKQSFLISLYDDINGFAKLPQIESLLIKNWRGVTRFSIVDVPTELSIEVPSFDSQDFQTMGDGDVATDVPGVQTRIDMVFLYAKPVDSSGVKIVNQGNSIQTITSPALGLVRGAGIKYSEKEQSLAFKDKLDPVDAFDSEGNAKILASPGDQFNENMGFTATAGSDIFEDVKGSFPSPDDLLNIAPLLSEKLEEDALELVGQSILPVAYIFVKQDSENILSTDVVDIRPFFRTAELTYNERAGLAAAVPQLSLANPAVGKAELQKEIYELNNKITTQITQQINDSLGTTSQVQIPEFMQLPTPQLIYKNPTGTGSIGSNQDTLEETLYIRDQIVDFELASGKAANETLVDLSLVDSVSLSFAAVQTATADTTDCRWFVYTGSKSSPLKPNTPGQLADHLINAVVADTASSKSVFGDYRLVLAMANAVTTSEASYRDQNLNSTTIKMLLNPSIDPFNIGIANQYLSFKHFQRVGVGAFRFACFLDGYTIKRTIDLS
jgi:hypothetical protein